MIGLDALICIVRFIFTGSGRKEPATESLPLSLRFGPLINWSRFVALDVRRFVNMLVQILLREHSILRSKILRLIDQSVVEDASFHAHGVGRWMGSSLDCVRGIPLT